MKQIPPEQLARHFGKKVHVIGWNPGSTFIYKGTSGGLHHLKTPSGGVYYHTKNALAYMANHKPEYFREILP